MALSAHFGAMVAHLGAQPLSRLLFVDNMDPKEDREIWLWVKTNSTILGYHPF